MPAAARATDNTKHDSPHCHAPIHPPAPTPTPMPHPPIPIMLTPSGAVTTVLIAKLPAAVVGTMTIPCMVPPCIPGGPGMVSKGSSTVLIGKLPAARVGDMVAFTSCVAPIPSPTGSIMPPGAPTVIIGG
jgi:uncharacterized Zn-binding protein involved in type VI secretion